jgi:hypothetical protein
MKKKVLITEFDNRTGIFTTTFHEDVDNSELMEIVGSGDDPIESILDVTEKMNDIFKESIEKEDEISKELTEQQDVFPHKDNPYLHHLRT